MGANKNGLVAAITVLVITLGLTACGESVPRVDLKQVLYRTVDAFIEMQETLESEGETQIDASHMTRVAEVMQRKMNEAPEFYQTAIGVEARSDAALVGFNDPNADGQRDKGEKTLFTIELDFDNERLIAIASNGYSAGYRMNGFAAGFLASSLANFMVRRQVASGYQPDRYKGRQIAMKGGGTTSRTQTQSRFRSTSSRPRSSYRARSSSRSGGVFGGK